jgi:ketosteroid isomerase-like protein
MSQENVEVVKAAFEAYNRGDLDAWLAEADPDIEWHVLPEATDPGPHRGRQVVLERAALWRQTLGDLRAEVLEYIDAGEYVVAPVRLRGRPPESDAEVVLDEVYVSKLRNGKVVELREYRTKAEALEALGLSE